MKEDVLENKLKNIVEQLERIGDKLIPKEVKFELDTGVQHSLIWGAVTIGIGIIILIIMSS